MNQNKVIFIPNIGPGMGYRYVLIVYKESLDLCNLMFTQSFNAPSMVIAGNMFQEWRKKFLELNGFKDDNLIYEIYNISLGKRRVIK